MLALLIALLLISILILVHEWGHFLLARHFGVKVFEFSLGFGRLLWKRDHKGTQLSIRAFPFGGFVRLAGVDKTSHDETYQASESFEKLTFFPKVLILGSGSFFNVIFAFIVLFISYSMLGVPQGLGTEIAQIFPNTPASLMSLQVHDRILQVNGDPAKNGEQIVSAIRQSEGHKLTFLISRDKQEMSVWIYPVLHPKDKIYYVGFRLVSDRWHRDNPLLAFWKSGKDVLMIIWGTLAALGHLVTGHVGLDQISGPIGIVSMTGQMVNYGLSFVARFVALLAVNLGVLNLLPIPALDGGRILILGLEKGLRIRIKDAERVHLVGALLLIGLMVIVTYLDIRKLLGK